LLKQGEFVDTSQLNDLRIWFYRDDNTAIRDVPLKKAVNQIKNCLGISLNVKDWNELRLALIKLEKISRNLDSWEKLRELRSFREVKVLLLQKLNHPIKARSWKILEERLLALRAFLKPQTLGANGYEQNKAHRFAGSSKLEGISVPSDISNLSKEDIIAKYIK